MNTKKVVLPLDGSPFSHDILEYVCQFIKPGEAELIVLRIAPWPRGLTEPSHQIAPINWLLPANAERYDLLPDVKPAFHPVYASQEAERVRGQILDELQDQTHQLRTAGYRTRCVVEFGEPAEEIINFVHHHDVDLVAMATHGRSGLSHLVLGSVAEQVLRNVRVPVLLVRPVFPTQGIGMNEEQQKMFSLPL